MNIQTVVCGDIQENAYVVSLPCREDCVVIDPGDEYPKLRRALGVLRVAAILLTHGHFDHIMAVGEMARAYGAPVYIASADMEMLNDPGLNGRANLMGVNRMGGPEIQAQPYDGAISAAGMVFSVLPTPGHSRGSVCLYEEYEAVLFSGDTLFEGGFGRVSGRATLEMWDYNIYDYLPNIKQKVLLLHGDADTRVPISFSERARDIIPNCEYHVIPGGKHGFRRETFDTAVAYIKDFISRL